VQLRERHRRDADVGGVGAIEEARAQHARRECERRLGRGHVERRPDQEVPERERCLIAHTALGEPGAERDLVELAIVGVERRERARDLRRAQPRGERQQREAEQARREVRRRGQLVAADPCERTTRARNRHGERDCSETSLLDAEPREQRAVGGAAAHEHVLTVVDGRPRFSVDRSAPPSHARDSNSDTRAPHRRTRALRGSPRARRRPPRRAAVRVTSALRAAARSARHGAAWVRRRPHRPRVRIESPRARARLQVAKAALPHSPRPTAARARAARAQRVAVCEQRARRST
jgi:hypothetical protein